MRWKCLPSLGACPADGAAGAQGGGVVSLSSSLLTDPISQRGRPPRLLQPLQCYIQTPWLQVMTQIPGLPPQRPGLLGHLCPVPRVRSWWPPAISTDVGLLNALSWDGHSGVLGPGPAPAFSMFLKNRDNPFSILL